MGRPAWSVAAGLSSWDALHAGEFDVVSDTVHELTGHEPITVGVSLGDAELTTTG